MEKIRSAVRYYGSFICILALQIIVITYFGIQKNWLFGDEQWTFNLANRYYEPFLGTIDASPYYGKWLSPDFWNSVLTVNPAYGFNYGSVFYNQSLDVHPPLYYLIIHTICSFFPNIYSKWFGIIPNIVFFLLSQFVIYNIGTLIFKKRYTALLLCLFYGFSWGVINNAVYVRMYGLLSLWAVISYYLHLKLMNRFNRNSLIMVLLFSLLGILTQYYFLIFQFFVSAGYSIYLLFKKEYKHLLEYCIGYLGILGAVIIIFPAAINQITGKVGNQGNEAFRNLVTAPFGENVRAFAHIISKDMFGGHANWVIAFFISAFFVSLLLRFVDIQLSINHDDGISIDLHTHIINDDIYFHIRLALFSQIICYTIFIIVGYFCTISKIAPFIVTRYLVITYPLISVLVVSLAVCIVNINHKSIKYLEMLVIIMTVIFSLNMYRTKNLFAYDPNYSKMLNTITQDYDSDIAFIIVNGQKGFWPVMHEALTMRMTKQSLLLAESDMKDLSNLLKSYKQDHQAFLAYKTYTCKMNKDVFVKQMTQATGYKKYKVVDSYMGDIYLFEK